MAHKRTHNKTKRHGLAPARGIMLPSGLRLNHGQMFTSQGENPMQKLNSPKAPLSVAQQEAGEGMARTGAPKNIVEAPPVYGMKRATVGPLAAYHHGVSVDDEPNAVKSFTRETPLHSAHANNQTSADVPSVSAKAVLTDAAKLGR
jgi:hypothetical protein